MLGMKDNLSSLLCILCEHFQQFSSFQFACFYLEHVLCHLLICKINISVMLVVIQGAVLLLSSSPPAARHVIDAAFDRQGHGKQLVSMQIPSHYPCIFFINNFLHCF
jgi:hypothetical protein